ncbi:5-hydroxytryptamine receptor 3A [Dissostichus eleginoides]|uniref:5-hydroxytryptamine receptor 3A n=1 Tax=Dissostichus eleginoides TaxID=100907 RepID=A0AAD9EXL4_DISEL|nr:5-hydroxytryptamine receptor 3A [Dissostichus eleginoides]
MLRFLRKWKALFLLSLLTVGCGDAVCTSRRCLAEMLIKKGLLSQPQTENCAHVIKVPFIEYQTLAVDTKNLRLISRLQARLEWSDPELKWNTSVYDYEDVVLPVGKVWTPEILVTNGIESTMKHNSKDLLVLSDGTLRHSVVINAEVNLSIKPTNPFITLLMPSILILLADIVSFALPLGGGERNCFKVTLVLSFTVFLNILNDVLPGDSSCSPIIRTHFCICLVFLVFSMLVSLVLTRLAKDGSLIFCCGSKGTVPDNTEVKADVSVVQISSPEEDGGMLKRVVNFLEAVDADTLKKDRDLKFANNLDKTFFWFYSIGATMYFIAMIIVMVKYRCVVNHFEFWY